MQTIHPSELHHSDVLAHVLKQGLEITLQEFPGLQQHRAAIQRVVDADQELNELELKTREAQARLDAADKDLAALLAAQLHAPGPAAAGQQ